MSGTKKIAIGLGVASGTLLAAWLLTGNRRKKTKDFIVKRVSSVRRASKSNNEVFDDSEAHYV